MIVSGGSTRLSRTRQSMRKVVIESVPKVLRKHRNCHCNCELCKQLYQLLHDPRNFRGNNAVFLAPVTWSEKAAVIKILDRLEGLPYEVLNAINRKLKGKAVKAPSRCGRSRDQLVKQVRRTSMEMLSELGKKDVLPEPLAKAMTIAVLSLKLISGPQSFSFSRFCKISTEMKTLQDDIVNALWLMRTKEFQSQELNKLRLLFDPSAKISSKYTKPLVKKMLTGYLFECSDVDAVPKSILEGLAFINRKSWTVSNALFSKDKLEEDIECILDLSARTKQIAWDLLPENEYHKGFTDAYLEELQESDYDESGDEDGDERSPKCLKDDGSETDLLVEGFGESTAVSFGQSPVTVRENNISPLVTTSGVITPKLEPDCCTGVDSASPWYTGPAVLFQDFKPSEGMDIDATGHMSSFCSPKAAAEDTFTASHVRFSANSFERHKVENDNLEDQKQYPSKELSWRNQYLAIQDACDETSMVAYDLVGFMLEELAQAEGLELDPTQRFYLKGDYSVDEELSVGRKKKATSWEDVKGSVIHRAVQKLIPSLPKSVMEKVEQILDFR
ncbi:uncharacterized protein LOC116199312 isoform X2 [Punica granatum]|nr:uncharacterized protein LOC116199312 isoform X2 [Punica granatum]